MALVVGSPYSKVNPNGKILLVMSDPFNSEVSSSRGILPSQLVNRLNHPSWNGASTCLIPTRCLIPIPPDSESKLLFADEPIERERIV